MSKVYVEVPGKVWLFIVVGSCIGLLSPNPSLTVASLLILPFLIFSFWRKGEPPILSFLLFYQWLEVTLKVFNADLAGIPVEGVVKMGEEERAIYFYSKEAAKAIWLSLGGLTALAVGMRLGLGRIRRSSEQVSQVEPSPFSARKLFVFYLLTFVFSASNYIVWRFMALSQLILALTNIKWAALFLLAYTILQRRSRYELLIFALLLEIVSGFLAFFAQFKGAIFIVALVFLTLHFRFRVRHIFTTSLVFALALYLGAMWTVVKKEYRTFLGEASQEGADASLDTKMQRMSNLVGSFNAEKIRRGLKDLSERISYVDYFSQVLQLVPRWIPYEGGKLWKKAVVHVLTPRLLFPDKLPLEPDSDVTRRYTGIRVAGGELGGATSIGIGYFAESYVDFGPQFMFIPILLVGILEGWVYRYFIIRSKTKIVGYAMSVAVLLFSGGSIATSSAKVLGGVLTNFIVLALFLKLFERSFVRRMISRVFAQAAH